MGHLEVIKGITFENRPKDIYVYVAHKNNKEPFIPIFIYDGQAVFDIYPSHSPFGINIQIDMLIQLKHLPNVILIGIPSTANRLKNLYPWNNGCKSFLTNTLIPYIEKVYPIRKPYFNIGFSAGGQAAIYFSRYAGIFEGAGAILPIWTPREHYELSKFSYPTYILVNSPKEAEKFSHLLKSNSIIEIRENVAHTAKTFRELLPHTIEVLLDYAKR